MVQITDFPSLWQTIQHALRLEATIFAEIQRAPGGFGVALLIVILAGVSESLGQSLVLFINRVPPGRFALAVSITAASHLVGYALWAMSVWLVGVYVFHRSEPILAVASAVGLAYAPQLLAFFVLTPYFGNAFSIWLSLWSMLAIVVAVRVGLGLETWQALLASGLGWALIQLWRRTIGRPIYALGRWLQRRAAGVPLKFSPTDLPRLRRRPRLLENLEIWRDRARHIDFPEIDFQENVSRLFRRDQRHG